MNHTYEPKICRPPTLEDGTQIELKPEYSGSITLKMPTIDERLALQVEAETLDPMAKLRLSCQKVKDHLVAVNITRLSDGFIFDSWDKLNYDSDMVAVVQEAALKLIRKFSVTDPS